MILRQFLLVTLFFFSVSLFAEEKPIVVIVPSYNNSSWYELNIRSILDQKYSNFRIIYIDDHSIDNTRVLVENLIKQYGKSFRSIPFEEHPSREIDKTSRKFLEEVNKDRVFFTLVSNQLRCGALANQYRSICSCDDNEIVVLVDGDDWLANDLVFQKLNNIYSTGDIWMTHGSLVEYPSGTKAWCEIIPPSIIASNSFRTFKCPSHLRTFYAGIFKKIRLEDLLYNGNFYPMTGDMAIMYPIAEMCGERHAFISDPTYIYNMTNPINDNKVDATLQRYFDWHIRKETPYQRLEFR